MKTKYITLTISLFVATFSFAQNTVNYQYDNENRIILSDDGTKIQQYQYDNLGNRTSYTITTTTSLPDLNVTNANIADTNITQGQTYGVSCTINNLENTDVIASTLKVYLSPSTTGTELEVGSYSVPSITANGNEVVNFNITIPNNATVGSQNLVFFTDAITAISETEETNNKQSIAVTVSESYLAELNIQNTLVSPSTVQAGNSVNVTADIFNEGTVDALNFNVKCFLSNNPTYEANDVLLDDATENFSMLNANSNLPYNKTVLIPSNTIAGNHYLLFVVDADNTVTETNETNNVTAKSLVVSTTGGGVITANFSANNTDIAIGNNVQFIDQSTNSPTSWQWIFEGGTPSTSTQQNPQVTYNALGTYDVTLVATNANGDHTEIKTDYITVSECQSDWNYIGTSSFSSENASELNFAISNNNVKYVAFKDAANSNKVTVMKFENGSWTIVGNAGFSHANSTNYLNFVIASDGTPYVSYSDPSNSNKVSVMKFNGTSWINVGSYSFTNNNDGKPSFAIDNSGTPYIVYQDQTVNYKLTVMKFNGSSWVNVGGSGITAGWAYHQNIAIDNNNIPYVAYQDDTNSDKARVKKFNGSSWVDVGNISISTAKAEYIDLEFDSNNIPYLAYRDWGYSKKTSVKKLSGNSWISVGTQGFSPEGQTWLHNLKLSTNDIPYVSFRYFDSSTGSSSETVVMKYENDNWQSIGNTDSSISISLYLDSNNIPHIAFLENSDSNKISVKKFACSSILDADFYANNTAVPTGSVVDFLDISTGEPTSWSWTFSPDTVTYVNGTDSTSQNPEVTFNNEGLYTVTLVASNSQGSDTETKTEYITVDNSLSIDDEELSSIVIYPNPTNNIIYIKNTQNVKIKQIEVYDLTGKLLNRIDDNPQSISFKDYASGIYLIKIKSDNGKVIKRIIKK